MIDFKLIVAGGRDFQDYELLKIKLDKLLWEIEGNIQIVCGKARGADTLGERYAKESGYSVKYFPADWDLHGKAAGHIRNEQMAEYGDALAAFWDGKSKGTKSMIDLANTYGLPVRIIKY